MSFLGILLALSVLLQLAGGYLEISTLFFLMAAALCTGIACYEAGLRLGGAFLIASVLLSLFLLPNKFYCLTYGVLSLYIYLLELIRVKTRLALHPVLLWSAKLLLFNGGFLAPALIFFRELLFSGDISWAPWVYALVVLAANGFLVLFDRLYRQLIPREWERLKARLGLPPFRQPPGSPS